MLKPLDFNDYHLKPLCRGGFARIYQAIALDPNQPSLTIKMLRSSLANAKDMRIRFRRETEILTGLKYRGIPYLVAADLHADLPYMAYRHIEGLSLLELIRKVFDHKPVPVTMACDAIIELLRALYFLHDRRFPIVHSDISLENILIDTRQDIHLIDFGCAQRLLTETDFSRRWAGKPSYLSPEQAQGLGWDHRSDLYQAGLALYELVTANRRNKGRSKNELMALAANPPPLDFKGVPRALRDFLEITLATEYHERWDTTEDCLGALIETRARIQF